MAWERAELQKLKEALIRDPYSMALVAEALEGAIDSEAPEVAQMSEDDDQEMRNLPNGKRAWMTRLLPCGML